MENINIIKEVLGKINQAYMERNPENTETFVNELFHTEEKAYITGTSDNELCFDYDKIKDLFKSDWQYWGDMNILIDKSIIKINNNFAWAHCPAKVKYSFSDNPETYSNFTGFIKEFYDGESYDSKKAPMIKLTEINWLLAHLLHSREPKLNREYFWDLRVFIVFKMVNSKWYIKHIQFSFPKDSLFADERFSQFTYYEKAYNKELEVFKANANLAYLRNDIKAFIISFFDVLLIKDSNETKEIADFLSDEILMIHTTSKIDKNKDNVAKSINELRNFWDCIDICRDSIIVEQYEENIWIHCLGLLRKDTSEEDLVKYTEESILKIFDKDIEDKEKLFLIRRNIATMLNESAYGYKLVYPFKFNAILSKKNSRYCFEYLQFSVPSNNILEQINEEF